MATTSFSWSDTARITFISCLPCLKPDSDEHSEHENQPYNPAINRIPRARPDELQGLLAEADSDVDAETVSLHSNPGRARRNKSKKSTQKQNNPRGITLFGYNLFGRLVPSIQLPDEDDALYARGDGDETPNTIVTAHSIATFDSDAAPLDSDAIAALSSSNATAAAHASADTEAQRLKEKEERRQRRQEKKELKRLAESLAARGIIGDGDEFEGFQGSGGLKAPALRQGFLPNPISAGSDSGSGSALSGSAREEYGRFVVAPSLQPEEEHDEADLDGRVYARKSATGSRGGSDSRSKTSMSDRGLPFNGLARMQAPLLQPQPSRKKTSYKTSATTNSSTTSQSPSLPSPISPVFSGEMVSPSTVEQGQGFFDAEDPAVPSIPAGEFPTTRSGDEFPMTGFKGLTGGGAKQSRDFGAFLARRGDEDEINGR